MAKPPPAPHRAHRAPPGLCALPAISYNSHRGLVLGLTFVAYALYHASRKPPSIVKRALSEAWPPFHDPALLGETDVAFLAFYSLGMFVAGHLGDRLDLRLFLAVGMIGSGTAVALFGVGYFLSLHSLAFYLAAQVIAGLLQSTGWPSVVAIVGNWFRGRRRGLIMGIWNAHTSIGNISGSLIAAAVLRYGWGWSFIVPGLLIAFGGVLVFFFLAPYPEDLGFSPTTLPKAVSEASTDEEDSSSSASAAGGAGKEERRDAVGMWKAFAIPGVITFALCLFFAKLVAYTFLYWLPFYLSQTAIGGKEMSVTSAGYLSALFDGSYLIISMQGPPRQQSSFSADLGTHKSLKGDSRALATVTSIIDATGSLGAALGPFITGFISKRGWDSVFTMLIFCALAAGVLLSRIVKSEIVHIIQNRRNHTLDMHNRTADSGAQPLLEGDT
uniref:Major facilitator superfamily (MFS) profile domain-containing protein n=1 Tax=Oryza glumipatula TaxID=40148 RepID=A0A0D9YVS2_9ORYZ